MDKPSATILRLIMRYVDQTGEKLETKGDLIKVKERFPVEWEKAEREEKYRESLWWKLPEMFRNFRGENEFTTLELEQMQGGKEN